MSGDRHMINKQHSVASSGYESLDHTHEVYTPPVMPNSRRPFIRPESESLKGLNSVNTNEHYSQSVTLPVKSQATHPNYTAPVHPPQLPRRDIISTAPLIQGQNFPTGPNGGEEHQRERSASPQLQHATLPGLGHVLILAPQGGSYPLDVGNYSIYSGGNPTDSYWTSTNATTQANRPTNTSSGMVSNAQQGSPLIVIKADHNVSGNKTGRSHSQPAANLQWYKRPHPYSHDTPDGRSGNLDKSYSQEYEYDSRRYSVPVPLEDNKEITLGGYDLFFLSSRKELQDFTCPICHLVFREPHLTDCCGGCFCQTCIAHHMSNNGHCPLCKNTNYRVFVDRNMERNVNRLSVRCVHESKGCTWNGSLSNLSHHIDLMKGDCEYITVSCTYCGQELSLNKLSDHKVDCPRRPFSCKFCNYQGIYEDMPSVHWPTCDGYPIPCPNECGQMDMPRRDISRHLEEECPKRPIECDFKFAGCHATYPRSNTKDHESNFAHDHLVMLGKLIKNLMTQQEATPSGHTLEEVQKLLAERDNEVMELRHQVNNRDNTISDLEKTVCSLKEDYEEIKSELTRLRSNILIPPYSFVVTRFTELRANGRQWFSRPFYTHPQGYRMCISMDCNGSDEGSGTHLSVYANLMKGEFDDDLQWPFCGVVVIQLLNQFGDKGHIVHEVPFSRDVSSEIGGRVQDSDLAESGLGVPQFVAHSRLQLDRYTNIGFIKSDCLHFCVLRVKLG